MKKLLALTIIAGTSIGIATGCSKANVSATGEAIGLVHGTISGELTTGYLGYASVTVKGGVIISVKIDESIKKLYGTTDGNNKMAADMIDIKGKDIDWAKKQLARTDVKQSYTVSKHTFAADTCYTKDKLTYTGIQSASSTACATSRGTWISKDAAVDFASGVTFTGKFADGVTDLTTTKVDTTHEDGINSKMKSQGTFYGYWDPNNYGSYIKGWAWNMSIIENNFIGLKWEDIADKDYNLATDVTGATASDRNQYAKVVKAAAKIAFGK